MKQKFEKKSVFLDLIGLQRWIESMVLISQDTINT